MDEISPRMKIAREFGAQLKQILTSPGDHTVHGPRYDKVFAGMRRTIEADPKTLPRIFNEVGVFIRQACGKQADRREYSAALGFIVEFAPHIPAQGRVAAAGVLVSIERLMGSLSDANQLACVWLPLAREELDDQGSETAFQIIDNALSRSYAGVKKVPGKMEAGNHRNDLERWAARLFNANQDRFPDAEKRRLELIEHATAQGKDIEYLLPAAPLDTAGQEQTSETNSTTRRGLVVATLAAGIVEKLRRPLEKTSAKMPNLAE